MIFISFQILFWKRGHKETSLKKIDIQKDETRRRRRSAKKIEAIVNLPAFSELSLSVVARNTYYEGPESNVIDVTTPEGGKKIVLVISFFAKFFTEYLESFLVGLLF